MVSGTPTGKQMAYPTTWPRAEHDECCNGARHPGVAEHDPQPTRCSRGCRDST